MIVISDTSPIANLLLIDHLHILPAVYGKIIISPAVNREVEALKQFGFDLTLFQNAEWIEQVEVKNKTNLPALLEILDLGEAESILLAQELYADFLLIDERIGWKEAQKRNIRTVGLLGTLVKAKELSIIPLVNPAIEMLRTKTTFRMSDKLILHVLKSAGE